MYKTNNSLIFGDLHLGVNKDSEWHQNIIKSSILQGIDYSVKNGINTWIQTGDFFDNTKAISHKTLEFSREIINLLKDNNITIIVNTGNHDAHLKNTLQPNAVREVLGKYDNVIVVDEPYTLDHGFGKIDIIPWMCNDNTSRILKYIENSSSSVCIGHFELVGFYYYKGLKSDGIDPNFLRNYKNVYSGHFHTISESGNVKYVGTPYTITAGDEDDIRGFYHLKHDGSLDFIVNPKVWHRKIVYPLTDYDINDYKDCSVRLYINMNDIIDEDFSKFQTELEKVVYNLRVTSLRSSYTEDVVNTEELKSTLSIFMDKVDSMNIDDKDDVKTVIKDLYSEASLL